MPVVPIYEPNVRLTTEAPAVPGNLEMGGLPGRGLEQLGEKGLQISAELNRQVNQARMVNELATQQIQAHQGLYAALEEVQKDVTNPGAWPQQFQQRAQEVLEQVSQLSQNPEVQAQFNKHWASLLPLRQHEVNTAARKQEILNFAGDFDNKYPQYIDLYVNGQDDLSQARAKSDLFGYIAGAQAAGIISPDKAEKARQGFDKAVMLGQANRDILQDPMTATDRLQEPAKNYPGMDAQTAMILQGRAHAEMSRRQEANAVQVEQSFQRGDLTRQGLAGALGTREISLPVFRMYDALLQTGPEGALDQDVYMDLFKKAQGGQLRPDELEGAVKAGKLGEPKQAISYYKDLMKMQEGRTGEDLSFTKDLNFRLALQEIDGRLKPIDQNMQEKLQKQLAGGLVRPRETLLPSHEAAYQLIEACKKAQAEGKLTGPWIKQKVQEIIQPLEVRGIRGLIKAVPPGAPAPPGRVPLFNPSQGPNARQQE